MPSLDVTLTYALPVRAEALAMQIQTHIETLPTLHTLRLCHRFGHGLFREFPVELIKMIEGYVVEPVREQVAEDLDVASRCFRNDCSLIDHADRETLLDVYFETAEALEMRHYDDDPDDDELLHVLGDYFDPLDGALIDEEEAHSDNRRTWQRTVRRIFSEANVEMFSERFGLDIWYSFVRLADNQRYEPGFGVPQAIITYLTLPGSTSRRHKWLDSTYQSGEYYEESRTIVESNGENGYGTAVEVSRQPSAKELRKFSQALNVLNLKVFVHPSQKLSPALKLGESDETVDPDETELLDGSQGSESAGDSDGADGSGDNVKISTFSFPRLTLLTRNKE